MVSKLENIKEASAHSKVSSLGKQKEWIHRWPRGIQTEVPRRLGTMDAKGPDLQQRSGGPLGRGNGPEFPLVWERPRVKDQLTFWDVINEGKWGKRRKWIRDTQKKEAPA